MTLFYTQLMTILTSPHAGLLKLTLNSLKHCDGNFRFLNQIEEIWFEHASSGNSSDPFRSGGNEVEYNGYASLNGVPPWVKDMESLQWIRLA